MKRIVTVLSLMAATPVWAHPHVFIDAGLAVQFDAAGRLTGVRISWSYDEFTSMMIMAEAGLDIDATLAEAEGGALAGFDTNWIEGFEGDSYLLLDGAPVPLGGPIQATVRVENGVITSTHSRDLAQPMAVDGADVRLQVYDPTYYTAYTIAYQPVIAGRTDCTAQIYGPDPDQASEILRAALAELSGATLGDDDDFPAIGADFAEELRLTCPAR